MALNQPKKAEDRLGNQFSDGVKAGVQIWQGGLVMLKAGVAVPAAQQADAATAGTCVVRGVAEKSVLGGAADGDVKVPTREGVFLFKNSAAGDLIAAANIGAACYAVDDETVALTSNANVRPKAGTIVDVESAGVWVRVGV